MVVETSSVELPMNDDTELSGWISAVNVVTEVELVASATAVLLVRIVFNSCWFNNVRRLGGVIEKLINDFPARRARIEIK